MTTFKTIILPHHRREDGTYNVKIRVTHNRKVKYIRTPHYVSPTDISKRKRNGKEELKIKNQAVVDMMDRIIHDYRKRIISEGSAVESWSIERLVEFLKHDTSTFTLDFIGYGRRYADSLINGGRESTGRLYHNAINSLVRFLGRESLDVMEITTNFLNAFERYLRREPKQKITSGKSVELKELKSDRTIYMCMQHVKVIYEAAKYEYNDEDNGIINIPNSPFSRYKMPKVAPSVHRVLTVDQIQKIIDHPYSGKDTMEDMAKDVFIMSFALMGINTADLYEVDGLEGDILTYSRKKTRSRRADRATMKVRIEPEIMGLLAKYKGKGRLFLFGEKYKNHASFNRAVNDGLDKVGKAIGVPELTFYYARHTMASICANVLGIEIARVDEMLNHSDPKLSLARVYIEKDFKPLWAANRRLLDLFDWSFYKNKAEG